MAATDVQSALAVTPRKNVMFGLTHDLDGKLVVRVPRAVKIGIGLPAGRDVELYIDHDHTWVAIAPGINEEGRIRYAKREQMQYNWHAIVRKAKTRNYPKKLEYFTFTKPGAEQYEPDFDMIEAHGPRPTEIDIMFVDDDPLDAGFQWWSKTELKCSGDGMNALRVLSLAASPEEKQLAAAAQAAGMDRFPIVKGCFSYGCPYADDPCKAMAAIRFQLLSCPRLGSRAYFHTSSKRSAINLTSGLHMLREETGYGDPAEGFVKGIPLKMVLRPHRVTIKGEGGDKSGTAYNVAIEFRAESAPQLRQKMMEAGLSFLEAQRVMAAPPLQLEPPSEDGAPEVVVDSDGVAEEETTDLPAAAIAQEFFPSGRESAKTEPQAQAESAAAPEDPEVLALWSAAGANAPKWVHVLDEYSDKLTEACEGDPHIAFELFTEHGFELPLTVARLRKAGIRQAKVALKDFVLTARRIRAKNTPPPAAPEDLKDEIRDDGEPADPKADWLPEGFGEPARASR